MNTNVFRFPGLSAPAAVATALLLLPGCPDPRQECDENEDCQQDQLCIDGFCEPAECDPSCEEGFECIHAGCFCASDEACEPWQMCEDGHCVADPDAECSPMRDCEPGYTCEEAICVCARDRVCEEGEVCDEGECRPATSCDSDAECEEEERLCVDGQCIEPCISADECGAPSIYYACIDGYCYSRCPLGRDTECDPGFICEEIGEAMICVEAECATLADCGDEDQVCTSADHGRCVTVTYCDQDDDCDWTHSCRAPDPCPPGFDCENDKLCLRRATCNGDDDCITADQEGYCDRGYCFDTSSCETREQCDEGFDCVGGACVPFVCRGPADCEEGEICSGGACVEVDEDEPVDRVQILTPGGHILEDEERQLVAVAYDTTERVIVGAAIEWSSSHLDRVQVDPETGIITGGTEPGEAIITAGYQGETDTATWRLLRALEENELRVTVVDGEGGEPVGGALVFLSEDDGDETDEDGVAMFTVEGDDPIDVHVFHEDHDYVSLFGVEVRDLLAVLPSRTNPNRAAGVTGGISYDHVSTEGDLAIGLAGTSLGGALVDFDLERLVGEMFVIHTQMGEVPLPAALTATVTYMGYTMPIKDTYYARGEAGLRMGWSFAGRLGLERIMGGGGGMSIANLLPLFGLFEHGLRARVPLTDRDLIQDIADINGNGDTDEMVPDWTNFPERNHSPAQTQSLRATVSAGELPMLDGSRLDTVVLMAGGRSPRIGLVPLGLSAVEGADEHGHPPPVGIRMAPVYGGLEVGSYQVIAMAVPSVGDFEMPREVSSRVFTTSQIPVDVELGDFLPLPEATTWNATSRTIDHAAVEGAHLLRSLIKGEDRCWHVFAPDPGEGSVLLELPQVPEDFDDLGDPGEVSISPMELLPHLTFEDLLHVTGPGILQLDSVTVGYSRLVR